MGTVRRNDWEWVGYPWVQVQGFGPGGRRAREVVMPEWGGRRKHERLRFETRVDLVYKGVTGFVSVRTGNISAGGVFVVMAQPPAPATVVKFGLMVGDKGHHRGTGEVVWSRPAGQASQHPPGFGLRFLVFAEGSSEAIEELVEQASAVGDGPTGHGEEPAVVDRDRAESEPVPASTGPVSSQSATVVAPLAEMAVTAPLPVDTARPPDTVAPPPQPTKSSPVGEATPVTGPAQEQEAAAVQTVAPPVAAADGEVFATADVQEPHPEPGPAEGEGTTVFDLRQAMSAMPVPKPEETAAATPDVTAAPATPAVSAPRAEVAAGETIPAEVEAESSAPKTKEPERSPAVAASDATGQEPGPAAKPSGTDRPAPVAAPRPDTSAPAKQRRAPRRWPRRGIVRLLGAVLVGAGLYLVATRTQWGAEQVERLRERWSRLTSRSQVALDRRGQPNGGRTVPAPVEPAGARDLLQITWSVDGATTVITAEADGPLTAAQVLLEELSRPPRALVRVRGITRPFAGFQERTDIPNLVALRVGHHLEFDPPELFLVVEPAGGAKAKLVAVSGRSIVIEVAPPPTPHARFRRPHPTPSP